MTRLTILLTVVCGLALAACGGKDKAGEADVPLGAPDATEGVGADGDAKAGEVPELDVCVGQCVDGDGHLAEAGAFDSVEDGGRAGSDTAQDVADAATPDTLTDAHLAEADDGPDLPEGLDVDSGPCKPPVVWQKTFGGTFREEVGDLVVLDEGGYAVLGSYSQAKDDDDFWLLRVSSGGELLWDKKYGGEDREEASSISLQTDGGFILAGYTGSKGAGDLDAWLVRVDKDGALLWDKTYGGVGNEGASDSAVLSDGSIVVLGHTESEGAGMDDVWLLKTDANGILLWDKTYGGIDEDTGRALAVVSDGGFVVASSTVSKGAGGVDLWVLRTDPEGNVLWDKTFGGALDDFARALLLLPDGKMVLAGGATKEALGQIDLWVLKLDAEGNQMWSQFYGDGDDEWALGLVGLPGAGFLVAGTSGMLSEGLLDGLAIRMDQDGQVLWDATFGGDAPDAFGPVTVNSGGTITCLGTTMSSGAGDFDLWMVEMGIECQP